MLALQTILLALKGVWANSLRSLLTVLGILVGVGCVITLMAYSAGARHELLEQFDVWGATRMGVYLQTWRDDFPPNEYLSLEDAQAIRDECWTITGVAAFQQQMLDVRRGAVTQERVDVLGTEPEYFNVVAKEFDAGRPFTIAEDAACEAVCVLGSTVKYDLFFDQDAVGQDVYVGGKRFTVVGVFAEQGGMRWMNEDEMVIIPFHTANLYIPLGEDWLELVMMAKDVKYIEHAKLQVRELLHLRHPGIPLPEVPEDADEEEIDDLDYVQVWTFARWRERREQTAESMAKFLIVMGVLALLVGAVGVMNVMLVTVEERTREIGLRKALGANRLAVLSQFLLEAFVISALGGGLGTLGAVVACRWMARLPDEAQVPDPQLTPLVIGVAVGVTLAIGLFAGMYPAVRASSVDPIEAMRYG